MCRCCLHSCGSSSIIKQANDDQVESHVCCSAMTIFYCCFFLLPVPVLISREPLNLQYLLLAENPPRFQRQSKLKSFALHVIAAYYQKRQFCGIFPPLNVSVSMRETAINITNQSDDVRN